MNQCVGRSYLPPAGQLVLSCPAGRRSAGELRASRARRLGTTWLGWLAGENPVGALGPVISTRLPMAKQRAPIEVWRARTGTTTASPRGMAALERPTWLL